MKTTDRINQCTRMLIPHFRTSWRIMIIKDLIDWCIMMTVLHLKTDSCHINTLTVSYQQESEYRIFFKILIVTIFHSLLSRSNRQVVFSCIDLCFWLVPFLMIQQTSSQSKSATQLKCKIALAWWKKSTKIRKEKL